MDLKRSQRIVKGLQGSRSFSDDLQNLKGSRRISEAQRLRGMQSISKDLKGSHGISEDLKGSQQISKDSVYFKMSLCIPYRPPPGGCNKVIFPQIA